MNNEGGTNQTAFNATLPQQWPENGQPDLGHFRFN